jgi:hypothetical protein
MLNPMASVPERKIVSLEQIWAFTTCEYNPYKSLENKIAMAQYYLCQGHLNCQDSLIVNHQQFTKTVLELGSLDDIKRKIQLLIDLEPLFNERNLLAILNNYNFIDKIRVVDKGTLVTVDLWSEPLRLKEEFHPCLQNQQGSVIYHKGSLYFAKVIDYFYDTKILSLDLDSNKITIFCIYCSGLLAMIGDLLYYKVARFGLKTLNVTDGKMVDIVVDDQSTYDESCKYFFEGNLLYIYRNSIIFLYDGSTSPPTLLQQYPFQPTEWTNCFKFIKGRVYTTGGDIYDLTNPDTVLSQCLYDTTCQLFS